MTSAERAARRRHKRRMEAPVRPRSVVKHGVCTSCGRRRQIVKPKLLCERCVVNAT